MIKDALSDLIAVRVSPSYPQTSICPYTPSTPAGTHTLSKC
jgi:hypothetical protein